MEVSAASRSFVKLKTTAIKKVVPVNRGNTSFQWQLSLLSNDGYQRRYFLLMEQKNQY